MANIFKTRVTTVSAVAYDGTQESAAAVQALDAKNVTVAQPSDGAPPGEIDVVIPVQVRFGAQARWAWLRPGDVAVASEKGVMAMSAAAFSEAYEPV